MLPMVLDSFILFVNVQLPIADSDPDPDHAHVVQNKYTKDTRLVVDRIGPRSLAQQPFGLLKERKQAFYPVVFLTIEQLQGNTVPISCT